ncbi:MAG: pyridoxal phosphate-dependent decarboxylase family protein [Pseudomonadales bacterium]
MTPEEFRSAAHALVDWVADHRLRLETLPVKAQVGPGEVKSQLPAEPPEGGESITALLADLEQIIVPGITQVQHPMHFGWFPSNASLASVLGDIASGGLGSLGISWESSPALTEVEEVVCAWMRQLLGLSEQWQGTIVDTASSACLVALLVARERASEFSKDRGGLQSVQQPLVVYTTEQAHSSVIKGALLAGFGEDNVRRVGTDSQSHAMRPDLLRTAIEEDIAAGRKPAAIIATVGTTGVTAMDPVAGIVHIAGNYDCWVHVDAAMAGSAMLLRECRWMWQGVEGADSISLNPHKWMGTILDCSLLYVRDPKALTDVLSSNPPYLRSEVDDEVVQYRDWGIPLGRRFRALKLWFHLRIDGPGAIRERLRQDLENATWFAEQVSRTPNWNLAAPVHLQTVCVEHNPGDSDWSAQQLSAHNRQWVERLNASGKAFLSVTELAGKTIVRVSIGVEGSDRTHLEQLWQLMQQHAQDHAKS